MASGDLAQTQGFTPVAPTDDFRLGYQRINDAADFAATRVRYYTATSLTGMNGLSGMKRGDLCFRSDESIEWRYDGTAWKRWNSDWIAYTPTVNNMPTSSVTGKYRFASGRMSIQWRAIANGTAGSGAILVWFPSISGTTVGTAIDQSVAVEGSAVLHQNGPNMMIPQLDGTDTAYRCAFRYALANTGAYFTSTSPTSVANGSAFTGRVTFDPS